jgi:hypothetical protein
MTRGVALAGLMTAFLPGAVAPVAGQTGRLGADVPKPVGIFVSKGTGPAKPAQVNFPHIDGWLAEFDWKLIEPSPGRYNWAPVQSDIALARRLHKKITLLFRSGPWTPPWVYQSGVAGFQYTLGAKYRKAQAAIMPIPWDPTFIKLWTRLIREAGRRFGNDDTVMLVHMSGSTKNGMELQLPFAPAERARWARAGYSEARVIEAWKPIIDAYAEAFPNKPLDFEIHQVLGSARVPRECVAYASKKLGPRLGVFGGWLSGKPEKADLVGMHSIMRDYGPKGFASFQMIGKQTDQGERFAPGGLNAAVKQGMGWNAQYFEIWLADAKNPGLARQVSGLRDTVKAASN